jgi:hypothetical protein
MKPPMLFDVLALIGLLLLAVGLWCIYPPLCLLALGISLLAVAVCGASMTSQRHQHHRQRRHKRRIEYLGNQRNLGRDMPMFGPVIHKGHLAADQSDDEDDG